MSLTKASYSLINGAPLNVLDYGAVADGTQSGGTASGTDNLAAFTAALAAAVTNKAGTVFVPSGTYYLSAKITIPASVTLAGAGNMKYGYFRAGQYIAGTILLINGAAGDDCIQFVENTTYSGLQEMSVYNTNTNAIRSVVSLVGILYAKLSNLNLASLQTTSGAGLYLASSSVSPSFQTLWTEVNNVTCDGNIRYGLQLAGTLLANNFTGGDYQGDWIGIYQTGICNSHTFTGVKIESHFAALTGSGAGFTPTYITAGLFGANPPPCYIYPVVQFAGTGGGNTFVGCYIEDNPAVITTYDDGVHGSLSLFPVFWNGASQLDMQLINMSWNSVYLYDVGASTVVDGNPNTPHVRHSTRAIPFIAGGQSGAAQSIPTATWTTLQAANFGSEIGTSELYWASATNNMVITSPGTYLINLSVSITPWTNSAQYWQCRLVGVRLPDSTTTLVSTPVPANGFTMIATITFLANLQIGDNPYVQVYQNSGGSLAIDQAQTFINAVKLN